MLYDVISSNSNVTSDSDVTNDSITNGKDITPTDTHAHSMRPQNCGSMDRMYAAYMYEPVSFKFHMILNTQEFYGLKEM